MNGEQHKDDGFLPPGPSSGVLLNPTGDQMVERDPLIAFSWYLSGRKNVLLAIAAEIVENLDQACSGPVVDGGRFERAESLMWLWTLGAYEVVRAMCQAKSCFLKKAWDELDRFKKSLSVGRKQGRS
jgi:hypothetical protein